LSKPEPVSGYKVSLI